MNTDIRLMLSFRNHPKSKKVRLKLGEGGVLGFIYLLMFVAESKPDGVLDGMDAEDIALAADYRNDPQEFCDALVAVRFLDFDGEKYAIHDWKDNNPWAAGARDRSEKARYAANVRHGNEPPPETENQSLTENNGATSTAEQCVEHEAAMLPAQNGNAPSPSPSPNPDQKQRPRKRDPLVSKTAFFEFAEAHDALTEAKDYESVLKKKKAACTERAWKGRLKSVEEIAAKGQSVKAAIAKSADSGWTGIFEVKPNGTGRQDSKPSAISRQEEAARRQAPDFA